MEYSVRIKKQQFSRLPLVFRSLGVNHLQDEIKRPSGMPIWQLFYCVKGSGEFIFGNRKSLIREGQAALIWANSGHYYQPLEQEWIVHYVGFGGNACQTLLTSWHFMDSGVFHLSQPSVFETYVNRFEEIIRSDRSGKQVQLSKELYAFLLDFAGAATRVQMAGFEAEGGLAHEISLYLEEHYREDISLEDLSRQFGLTREHLCTKFREAAGETIVRYLTKVRVYRARLMMLEDPDASLAAVAAACGFHSTSYFGKVFREETGMTPGAARRGV